MTDCTYCVVYKTKAVEMAIQWLALQRICLKCQIPFYVSPFSHILFLIERSPLKIQGWTIIIQHQLSLIIIHRTSINALFSSQLHEGQMMQLCTNTYIKLNLIAGETTLINNVNTRKDFLQYKNNFGYPFAQKTNAQNCVPFPMRARSHARTRTKLSLGN